MKFSHSDNQLVDDDDDTRYIECALDECGSDGTLDVSPALILTV